MTSFNLFQAKYIEVHRYLAREMEESKQNDLKETLNDQHPVRIYTLKGEKVTKLYTPVSFGLREKAL